jgi:hypothetical protein
MPPYLAPWRDKTGWTPLLLLINTGRTKGEVWGEIKILRGVCFEN